MSDSEPTEKDILGRIFEMVNQKKEESPKKQRKKRVMIPEAKEKALENLRRGRETSLRNRQEKAKKKTAKRKTKKKAAKKKTAKRKTAKRKTAKRRRPRSQSNAARCRTSALVVWKEVGLVEPWHEAEVRLLGILTVRVTFHCPSGDDSASGQLHRKIAVNQSAIGRQKGWRRQSSPLLFVCAASVVEVETKRSTRHGGSP